MHTVYTIAQSAPNKDMNIQLYLLNSPYPLLHMGPKAEDNCKEESFLYFRAKSFW